MRHIFIYQKWNLRDIHTLDLAVNIFKIEKLMQTQFEHPSRNEKLLYLLLRRLFFASTPESCTTPCDFPISCLHLNNNKGPP